jgi:hypothetical protein
MSSNEIPFVDQIEKIPFVGQLWADTIYTMVGLNDAMNLRRLRNEKLVFAPANADVVTLPERSDKAEAIQEAA